MSEANDMLGKKISNSPESNSFVASFMHLKLRQEHKEDYTYLVRKCVGERERECLSLSLRLRLVLRDGLTQLWRLGESEI